MRFALLCAQLLAVSASPCDIFRSASTPCVAAHSVVRALYQAYNGPLYAVMRTSDAKTLDIGVLAPGGFADAAAQDQFCASSACTISKIYDQSEKGNHLAVSTTHAKWMKPVNATKAKVTVAGHSVYAAYFEGGMGYRNDTTTGIAKGDEPETLYMVTAGTHYNDRCW